MRTLGLGLGLVGSIAVLGFLVLRPAAGLRWPRTPEHLPHAWRTEAGDPSGWVFVRDGCPHCATHLRALDRCLRELPPQQRARALRCLHVVGHAAGMSFVVLETPESWRDSLGVRFTPTTLWAAPDGRIHDAWIGARDERVWRRALARLAAAPGGS